MLSLLLTLVAAIALAVLVHEGGHCLAARHYGERANFKLKLSPLSFRLFGLELHINVPRGVWNMPDSLTDEQKKTVAIAGFGTEITLGLILFIADIISSCTLTFAPVYQGVVLLHILLYKHYAGDYNDFNYL